MSCLWKHEANEDKEAACVCLPENIPGQVEFFDEGKAQFWNVGMTPKLTFVSKRGLKHCVVHRADSEVELAVSFWI